MSDFVEIVSPSAHADGFGPYANSGNSGLRSPCRPSFVIRITACRHLILDHFAFKPQDDPQKNGSS